LYSLVVNAYISVLVSSFMFPGIHNAYLFARRSK
jgi:hypothetical protein